MPLKKKKKKKIEIFFQETHYFLHKAEERDIKVAVESPRVLHIYIKKKKKKKSHIMNV